MVFRGRLIVSGLHQVSGNPVVIDWRIVEEELRGSGIQRPKPPFGSEKFMYHLDEYTVPETQLTASSNFHDLLVNG